MSGPRRAAGLEEGRMILDRRAAEILARLQAEGWRVEEINVILMCAAASAMERWIEQGRAEEGVR